MGFHFSLIIIKDAHGSTPERISNELSTLVFFFPLWLQPSFASMLESCLVSSKYSHLIKLSVMAPPYGHSNLCFKSQLLRGCY